MQKEKKMMKTYKWPSFARLGKNLDSIILNFKGVKMRLGKVMKGVPSYLIENHGF
jgi:hypothetical protein